MTAPGAERPLPIDGNPFPAQAAAETQHLDADVTSIDTAAVRKAVELLDAYFGRRTERGAAVTVAGDHGTGKTHLLFQLLRRVKRHGSDARFVYVDAQMGTFHNLYRNSFLTQFDRDEMTDRVREHYANIVADSLQNTGFPPDIAERLRTTDIDPQKFVRQFNLAESTLLENLNASLSRVTRNEEFGTALVLLLRADLRDAVWEWLRGERPNPLLVERGIESHLSGDAQALEAMGVIALLYRGRARHLVLAFDQLDKVVSSVSPPEPATVTALQRLIMLMAEQGVFLVLSGLSEFLGGVGREGQDHGLSAAITTEGLSPAEVRAYIEESIARTGRPAGLGPFSPQIVESIAELADHSARKMIQICHACYRDSLETGEVTGPMVLRAARSRVEPESAVRTRIEAELGKQARGFEVNHPVSGPGGPRAPYWVPAADTGCALFVRNALVVPDDVEDVITDVDAVRAAAPRCRTALIVNGFLSERIRDLLNGHFTEPPLVYAAEPFSDEFARLMRRMTEQLEAAGDDQMRSVRASVSRLAEAQGNTQRYLEMLAYQVELMRTASEQQYTALSRRLQTRGGDEQAVPLPDEVEQLFAEVLTTLAETTDVRAALAGMFGDDSPGVASGLLLRLQNGGVVRAVGAATLAETVVGALRDAVREWHQRLDGPPNSEQRAALDALCRHYETVMEYLPIQALETSAHRDSDPLSPGSVGPRDVLGLPQADVYTLLSDLAYRVRRHYASGGTGRP
jgi:hypothetical protein